MKVNNKIKKIPYGIADYHAIRFENYYYVDKTLYLKEIENAGKYLFFIRPRRFGKSLFLSVMEAYYDILTADKFEQYFRGTKVFNNPTAEKNSYLILKLNFSAVDPDLRLVEDSFLNNIRGEARLFISRYKEILKIESEKIIENLYTLKSPPDILKTISDLTKQTEHKLFIIIDEYDNFANTILSIHGSYDYQKLTHGEGFFRAFFNFIKAGTTGLEASIARLFVTGVSPITMDDVTSGFNIGENISLDEQFSQMLGFNKIEVEELISYYRNAGLIKHETDYLIDIMNQWYNNYQFAKHVAEKLYNTDMVLYFLKQYFKTTSIPDDLIDRNVRIDYGKLRHLIVIDRGDYKQPNGNFSKLKEIIEEGEIISNIVKGFPVEEMATVENFISLLFYFGLLTIKEIERDKLKLSIPNETIKRLFYDYIKRGYKETDVFSLDLYKYSRLMSNMAYDGDWRPLFEYITTRMKESMSLRDLITGEKSIQAFLNVYLGLSELYIIHAEKELNKGFADLLMEPFIARYEGMKYSYLVEIKYINREQYQRLTAKSSKGKETEIGFEPDIKIFEKAAEEQLKKYSADEKLKKQLERTKLIKLILVFSGHELIYMEQL